MKTLIISMILSIPVHQAHADSYRPGDTDKILHTSISFAGALLGAAFLEQGGVDRPIAQIVAGTTMLMIGLGKEAGDPTFSEGDLIADGVGIAFGLGVSFAL